MLVELLRDLFSQVTLVPIEKKEFLRLLSRYLLGLVPAKEIRDWAVKRKEFWKDFTSFKEKTDSGYFVTKLWRAVYRFSREGRRKEASKLFNVSETDIKLLWNSLDNTDKEKIKIRAESRKYIEIPDEELKINLVEELSVYIQKAAHRKMKFIHQYDPGIPMEDLIKDLEKSCVYASCYYDWIPCHEKYVNTVKKAIHNRIQKIITRRTARKREKIRKIEEEIESVYTFDYVRRKYNLKVFDPLSIAKTCRWCNNQLKVESQSYFCDRCGYSEEITSVFHCPSCGGGVDSELICEDCGTIEPTKIIRGRKSVPLNTDSFEMTTLSYDMPLDDEGSNIFDTLSCPTASLFTKEFEEKDFLGKLKSSIDKVGDFPVTDYIDIVVGEHIPPDFHRWVRKEYGYTLDKIHSLSDSERSKMACEFLGISKEDCQKIFYSAINDELDCAEEVQGRYGIQFGMYVKINKGLLVGNEFPVDKVVYCSNPSSAVIGEIGESKRFYRIKKDDLAESELNLGEIGEYALIPEEHGRTFVR